MDELKGKKFAIPIGNIYDEKEFLYPYFRIQEAGGKVVVFGEEAGVDYKGKSEMKETAEKAFSSLKAKDFDGVVIPGGFAPDYMRRSKHLQKFVKDMFTAGKLVAFICHAGWVPISSGIMKGKKATSTPGIKDDMVNAGCIWEDKSVVVDGNMISSRRPGDLPEFMKAILAFYAKK